MKISIVKRDAFSVIGLLGSGRAINAVEWIQPLWQQAFARRGEIQAHIRPEAWGLMSGDSAFLSPWAETGAYLAGWETKSATVDLKGWHIWQVPPHVYATVECTLATYQQALGFLKSDDSAGGKYTQSGAVHEYYPPSFRNPATDSLQLCMMIREN